MSIASSAITAARLVLVPAALGVLIWAKVHGQHAAEVVKSSTIKLVAAKPIPAKPTAARPPVALPATSPTPIAAEPPTVPPPAVPSPTPLIDLAKPDGSPKPPTVTIGEAGNYMVRIRINGQGTVFFPSFEGPGEYPIEVRAEKR